eukprot:scaffold22124_cov44-Phaeocystis_antarctica.AAC.1
MQPAPTRRRLAASARCVSPLALPERSAAYHPYARERPASTKVRRAGPRCMYLVRVRAGVRARARARVRVRARVRARVRRVRLGQGSGIGLGLWLGVGVGAALLRVLDGLACRLGYGTVDGEYDLVLPTWLGLGLGSGSGSVVRVSGQGQGQGQGQG